MKKGKLIVIEGACDGIGKTTQYEALTKKLKDDKIAILKHHFPSWSETQGAFVAAYLGGKYGEKEKLSRLYSARPRDRGRRQKPCYGQNPQDV